MIMYCERYKCTMPEKTCLLRQKKYDSHVAYNTGNRDPGCANCAQGKAIKQQMKGQTMTDTAVKNDTPAAGKAEGMDRPKEGSILSAAPKTKRCPKCGQDLPADLKHFYEDIRGRLNLSCWCKECQRERGRQRKEEQRQQKRQAKQQAETAAASDGARPWVVPAADVPKITPEEPRPRPRRVVTLDFTDRPKMLDRIEKAARLEFRTVELEILYWANLGIKCVERNLVEQANESPWWAQEEETA